MFERVFQHKTMLGDEVRMDAYKKGIHEVVKEGDVIADIGTGSGILAFFAVQAGAGTVYAAEQDSIIEEAEKLAKIRGLDNKIVFMKGKSDRVELPEKVDVITSELIGYFGLEENLLHFKINARERFLKPGGRLVPAWLELYLVPVESEVIWKKNIGPWTRDYYGFDFSPVRDYAVSQRYLTNCTNKVNQLAAPSMISHIDFYEIEKIPFVFEAEFAINKNGRFHGLMGYFRSGLSPNVVLSTSSEEPVTHWEQTFFPLEDMVLVEEGDEVSCKIKAIPQMNTVFWEWRTSVNRKGKKIGKFNQSNLHISKEELVMGRKDFKPVLSQDGEMLRRVLELCDGKRSMGEISAMIMTDYPEKYENFKDAMQQLVGILQQVVKI
ncbi:MAG: 50S ribosomal protein L11 methyltransferase [Deltaproteobacteria bacterium]|nr:50S ribosomal protein L11 methyltransferase [Deltaproteobacteria bacterium]